MSTYFVNITGSDTSPFDTPAKGAHSISYLHSQIPPSDNDIVEVVNDNNVMLSSDVILINKNNYTIRSYGSPDAGGKDADDIDRYLNKPTILLIGNEYGFFSQSATNLNLQNIHFLRLNATSVGMFQINSSCSIKGCFFEDVNPSKTSYMFTVGGGNSNISFINNIFKGAAIVGLKIGDIVNSSNVVLYNNAFYNCGIIDDTNHGAVELSNITSGKFVNNIISNFSSKSFGLKYQGTVSLSNNYNNIFNTTNPYIGTSAGTNSIALDPVFENALENKFKLSIGSPCIDTGAGDIQFADVPIIDYEKTTRPQNTAWDMGPFEYLAH